MSTSHAATFHGLPPLRSEWVGLLGGPLGWTLQFFLIYPLTLAVCAGHTSLWLHASALVGLSLAVWGGLTALRNWRATEQPESLDASAFNRAPVGRARLMAIVGMMSGSLFGLLILAQWIAIVILEPCPQ